MRDTGLVNFLLLELEFGGRIVMPGGEKEKAEKDAWTTKSFASHSPFSTCAMYHSTRHIDPYHKKFISCNMTSKSFSQAAFFSPESSPEASAKDERTNYRHPTVYDAVAGMALSLVFTSPASN